MSDSQENQRTYPEMTGVGENLPATQEIHIFLLPLNPDADTVERYYAAAREWNEKRLPKLQAEHGETATFLPMKPCLLALIFRDGAGQEKKVCVMQSARYVRCNDAAFVVQQAHADAEWFREHGFDVVREKIEASAHGIDGIPKTAEAAEMWPKLYFEFHIKVQRKNRSDSSAISEDEVRQLQRVSVDFSRRFKTPVPLSYNENKNKTNEDGKGHQRFLNLRFRGLGISDIEPHVRAVREAIGADTDYETVKTISEFVWFDTFPAMDKGWIDYTDEERALVCSE